LAPTFQHFFGFQCYFPGSMSELRRFAHPICFDQLYVTGPFYASAAYSLGAYTSTTAAEKLPAANPNPSP
jgi:hypothetical protein